MGSYRDSPREDGYDIALFYLSQGGFCILYYHPLPFFSLPILLSSYSPSRPWSSLFLRLQYSRDILMLDIYSLYECLYILRHRKDFRIMLAHHSVSICVVMTTYCFGLRASAASCFILHDVGDVSLSSTSFSYPYLSSCSHFFPTSFTFSHTFTRYYIAISLFDQS